MPRALTEKSDESTRHIPVGRQALVSPGRHTLAAVGAVAGASQVGTVCSCARLGGLRVAGGLQAARHLGHVVAALAAVVAQRLVAAAGACAVVVGTAVHV